MTTVGQSRILASESSQSTFVSGALRAERPEAARIVLNADVDKILVPLDVCEDNRVADSMLTRDDITNMTAVMGDNPVVAMIRDIFPIYIDIWREFFGLVGFPMDDVITVALCFAPELVTTTEPLFADVVLDKGVARGQTVAYRGHQILPGGEGPKTTRIATGSTAAGSSRSSRRPWRATSAPLPPQPEPEGLF